MPLLFLCNRKVLTKKTLCKLNALRKQSITIRRWKWLKNKRTTVPIIDIKNSFMKKVIHVQQIILCHACYFSRSHPLRWILDIFAAEFLYKFFVIDGCHLQSKSGYLDFSMEGRRCKRFLFYRRRGFVFSHSPFV